jgi:hypothetical protein
MSLVPQPSEGNLTASESLAQTLVIGNTTGANDIAVSNPQKVAFAGNISLKNNASGAGSDVIVDTIPANTGPLLTQGVFVDTATNKIYRQFQQNETLAQTLIVGNTTGANDIVVSNPQKIQFAGNINIQGNASGLGTDCILGIPANTGPNLINELCYDSVNKKVYYQQQPNSFPTQTATYGPSTNPGPAANIQYANNANIGMCSGGTYGGTYITTTINTSFYPAITPASQIIIQGLGLKPFTATATSPASVGTGMPLADRIWYRLKTYVVINGIQTVPLGFSWTITNTTTSTTITNCFYNLSQPKFSNPIPVPSSGFTYYEVDMEDCFVVGTSSFLSVNDILRFNLYAIWLSPNSGTTVGSPNILEGVERAFYPV